MQRLHPDQPVDLVLDEVPESIQCRVHDVQGPVSRLVYEEALPPKAVGLLVRGSVAGYVLFDEFGAAVGLRVAVRASPPYLDVAITDGLEAPERRANERVKLVTRARIISAGDEGDEGDEGDHGNGSDAGGEQKVEWTYSIDLSETGALLRDHPAFSEHERFGLEFTFGSDPKPIAAQAEVVRRAQDAVGVRFTSISISDANRLGGYLMGIRHQRRAR